MLDEDPEPKSRDVADTLREDAPLLSRSEACFTERYFCSPIVYSADYNSQTPDICLIILIQCPV